MEETCRRALEFGLPAIAFTDHADFNPFPAAEWHQLDVAGYLDCVERCRAAFPDLRLLSGVELGEPHRFAEEAARVLAAGRLDRVLGSVHCVEWGGVLVDTSVKGILTAADAPALMGEYLAELLALVESSQPFEILAHLDYPKRYWPEELGYDDSRFEEPLRAVLRAAARRGSVLEVNTTRARIMCPGAAIVGWWREEGGAAVSFGSDAHDPSKLAAGFELAAQQVEAAGFRPAADPTGYWLR